MALTDGLAQALAHGIARFGLWALKNGYRTETLTGTRTLTQADPAIFGPDPDGAKTVVLDGAAGLTNSADPAFHGLVRLIVNRADGAEDITVDDADRNTIGTISQNEMALFYHDGIDADGTDGSGWALVAIVAIALS